MLFISICILSCIPHNVNAEQQWKISVSYSGGWDGAVGNVGSSSSVEGFGNKEFQLSGDIVSALIQKNDDSKSKLCVYLYLRGSLEESACTSSAYGIVSVGGSDYGSSSDMGIAMLCGWFAVIGLLAIITIILKSADNIVNSPKKLPPNVNSRFTHQNQIEHSSFTRREQEYLAESKSFTSLKLPPPPPPTKSIPIPPPEMEPNLTFNGYDLLDYQGRKWRRKSGFHHWILDEQ
jgi:hypothetical protein